MHSPKTSQVIYFFYISETQCSYDFTNKINTMPNVERKYLDWGNDNDYIKLSHISSVFCNNKKLQKRFDFQKIEEKKQVFWSKIDEIEIIMI